MADHRQNEEVLYVLQSLNVVALLDKECVIFTVPLVEVDRLRLGKGTACGSNLIWSADHLVAIEYEIPHCELHVHLLLHLVDCLHL